MSIFPNIPGGIDYNRLSGVLKTFIGKDENQAGMATAELYDKQENLTGAEKKAINAFMDFSEDFYKKNPGKTFQFQNLQEFLGLEADKERRLGNADRQKAMEALLADIRRIQGNPTSGAFAGGNNNGNRAMDGIL